MSARTSYKLATSSRTQTTSKSSLTPTTTAKVGTSKSGARVQTTSRLPRRSPLTEKTNILAQKKTPDAAAISKSTLIGPKNAANTLKPPKSTASTISVGKTRRARSFQPLGCHPSLKAHTPYVPTPLSEEDEIMPNCLFTQERRDEHFGRVSAPAATSVVDQIATSPSSASLELPLAEEKVASVPSEGAKDETKSKEEDCSSSSTASAPLSLYEQYNLRPVHDVANPPSLSLSFSPSPSTSSIASSISSHLFSDVESTTSTDTEASSIIEAAIVATPENESCATSFVEESVVATPLVVAEREVKEEVLESIKKTKNGKRGFKAFFKKLFSRKKLTATQA